MVALGKGTHCGACPGLPSHTPESHLLPASFRHAASCSASAWSPNQKTSSTRREGRQEVRWRGGKQCVFVNDICLTAHVSLQNRTWSPVRSASLFSSLSSTPKWLFPTVTQFKLLTRTSLQWLWALLHKRTEAETGPYIWKENIMWISMISSQIYSI